jgi:hypothetical protein
MIQEELGTVRPGRYCPHSALVLDDLASTPLSRRRIALLEELARPEGRGGAIFFACQATPARLVHLSFIGDANE